MKKIVSIALSLIMVATLLCCMIVGAQADDPAPVYSGTPATAFESGAGTAQDPFVIKNGEQLMYFAGQVNGGTTYEDKYIVLSSNIDMGGKELTPIGGTFDGVDKPFSGNFNGKGYTISNFTITNTNENLKVYAGLFGYVNKGTVKNVKVSSATIDVVGPKSVGGSIVGFTQESTISCCQNDATTTVYVHDNEKGNDVNAGGIVGKSGNVETFIENCINKANVKGENTKANVYAGGIVALAGGLTHIKNCENEGNVEATATTSGNIIAGGIAGCLGAGSKTAYVENCVNKGAVKSLNMGGGIVGKLNTANCEITGCYTTGSVFANMDWSGLGLGRSGAFGTITNCGFLTQTPEAIPEGYTVWYCTLWIGKNYEKNQMTVVVGSFTEMGEATISPLITAIETSITTNMANALNEEATTVEEVTTAAPEEITTAGEKQTEAKTEAKTEVTTEAKTDAPAIEEKKGCGSAMISGVVILTISAFGMAFASKKKEN